MRPFLFALTSAVAIAASGEARAQYVPQPDGSLGLPNGDGTYTIIHPSRLLPGAELVVPGTVRTFPNGQIWVNGAGRVGGNLIDENGNSVLISNTEANDRQADPRTARPVQGTARPVQRTARPVQGTTRPVQGTARPVQGTARPASPGRTGNRLISQRAPQPAQPSNLNSRPRGVSQADPRMTRSVQRTAQPAPVGRAGNLTPNVLINQRAPRPAQSRSINNAPRGLSPSQQQSRVIGRQRR